MEKYRLFIALKFKFLQIDFQKLISEKVEFDRTEKKSKLFRFYHNSYRIENFFLLIYRYLIEFISKPLVVHGHYKFEL